MKKVLFILSVIFLTSSCVLKKNYVALEAKHKETKEKLLDVKANLINCTVDIERKDVQIANLEASIRDLKKDKEKSIEFVESLTVLTKGANDNIKETLTQLSKKDFYINRIRAATFKKDSLNLVVAVHLSKELKDGIDDEDIEINVEKTVVFISISDKLLFKSGSYNITKKAHNILEKIAIIVNDQPEMDVMIEGHTDSTPIKTEIIRDNWDLSTKRATAITRILQNKFGVNPSRLIAAGRSSYIPLAPNNTKENKSKNRRTKIIILPKLNQFFDLLEEKVE